MGAKRRSSEQEIWYKKLRKEGYTPAEARAEAKEMVRPIIRRPFKDASKPERDNPAPKGWVRARAVKITRLPTGGVNVKVRQ